eukprot:CAMPEP_0113544188 /NCGR_PEP_ID=MMETSP0015_2-20120614/10573_1 /TAXON_ID=2838 /ORGANISM="Odontella" /LENGTH=428 /DNA_ID=CAMNT_0000444427 /DNA_START=2961 /DNA_END=4247 /DNA_ORIENTATION=- /assembly_acc=CAM_ASM_000160
MGGDVGEAAATTEASSESGGDEGGEAATSSPAPSSSASAEPALDLFAAAPPPVIPRELPPVDSDAVLRAMSSIRLRAPSLASNLDNYTPQNPHIARTAERLSSVPKIHPVIPRAPLSAFRRDTSKAVEATANLSRSATLAEAVRRCVPSALAEAEAEGGSGGPTLTIHVLGCDHVECASAESMRSAFGPFVRWMGAVVSPRRPPREILLELVGPNVGEGAERRGAVNLLPSGVGGGGSGGGGAGAGLRKAEVTCRNATYHEYLSSSGSSSAAAAALAPDLIVAYNAGIWGYDSWVPTLEYLCRHLKQSTPAVITGYTLQEVEDDAEVVEEVLLRCRSGRNQWEGQDGDGGGGDDNDEAAKEWLRARNLWSPEVNPFGSRKKRETATAPSEGGANGETGVSKKREYRENGAWQAWTFGGSEDMAAASAP